VSTAILITGRLKSTRLPMKALKPIMGRPMIGHMIDRLKLARTPERIILCTSDLPQDDPLEELAIGESIACFRGDAEDVLVRLTRAAQEFHVDTAVNCTADNPFVDPEYLDRLVEFHSAHHYDYSKSYGLPFGTFSYATSRSAMERACAMKAETDTEVWGGYFTDTGNFSWGVMEVTDQRVRWPELRLTVDTPKDFELVTRIFEELYQPGRTFPLEAIVELCRKRPDLVAINALVEQKPGIPIRLKANK
jgi:spore coat polysaccharide biosynthesis protein SpsF